MAAQTTAARQVEIDARFAPYIPSSDTEAVFEYIGQPDDRGRLLFRVHSLGWRTDLQALGPTGQAFTCRPEDVAAQLFGDGLTVRTLVRYFPVTPDLERPALPAGWAWAGRPSIHGSLASDVGGQLVVGDRRVLLIPGHPWRWSPETCLDDSQQGEWVLDGQVLVCRGCGLDST